MPEMTLHCMPTQKGVQAYTNLYYFIHHHPPPVSGSYV